jgi:predicted sugar kinase
MRRVRELADARANELAPTERRFRIPGVGVYVVNGGEIVDSHIYLGLASFRGAADAADKARRPNRRRPPGSGRGRARGPR